MDGLLDVIVVGAGVMGSAAAYYLSKELPGNKILLIEQFDFLHRKGSSHGESRIIRTTYPQEYYTVLMKDAYKLWAEAEGHAGTSVFTKTGGIDFSTEDNVEFQSVIKHATKHGVPFQILSSAQVTSKYPTIKVPPNTVGLYSPDGGILNATKSVAMFQSLAKGNKCNLLDNTKVTKIEEVKGSRCIGNNSYVLVKTSTGKMFITKKLIVTAGAWTGKLLSDFAKIPLKIIKTTNCYWKVDDPTAYSWERFPVFINYGHPNVYGTPAKEFPNMIKCSAHYGQPCDPDTRDFDPDTEHVKDVIGFVNSTFKGVGTQPTFTESCMYSLSPDNDFIIDFIPGSQNILIGCGFSGHGFKLAPVVGNTLAQLAIRGEFVYPEVKKHLSLSRFFTSSVDTDMNSKL